MNFNRSHMYKALAAFSISFSNSVQAQPVTAIPHITPKLITVQVNLFEEAKSKANRATSFSSKKTLYVIDGKPVWTGILPPINLADITNVTTLKDSDAAALYGSNGADGVIIITTRRFPTKYIHQLFTKKGHLN